MLYSSTKKDKRLMIIINGKKIHFGYKHGKTFIDHKDKRKKAAWIARHSVNPNFNNPDSPIFWSHWVLWNKPDLVPSYVDALRKYRQLTKGSR